MSNHRNIPKKDLLAYAEWFHQIMPSRIDQLEDLVRGTKGYKTWSASFNPASLGPLGKWFAAQVETRTLSKEELRAMQATVPSYIDVSDQELTPRTFSVVADVGMYFGQVVFKNVRGTRWDQNFRKNNINYGHPVVAGFVKNVTLSPIGVATSLAYRIAGKRGDEKELLNTYKVWAETPIER